MFNYMITQHQHFKLQMQPQEVSGYDHSLSKATSQKIFVSAYLAPDLYARLDLGQVISRVLPEPYNIDPHIPCLLTQMLFVTSLSYDIKPGITKHTSRNIFVSDYMAPNLSSSIDDVWVISQVSREPFLL